MSGAGWLAVHDQLPAALHRELQADSDLSLQDFDVLVKLTDAVEGRVRVSELATALQLGAQPALPPRRSGCRAGGSCGARSAPTTGEGPSSS